MTLKDDLFGSPGTDTNDLDNLPISAPERTELEKQVRKLIDASEAQKRRTWSYYQDLKTKNPTEYWRTKTQVQMHKDALALGEAFADGDFND